MPREHIKDFLNFSYCFWQFKNSHLVTIPSSSFHSCKPCRQVKGVGSVSSLFTAIQRQLTIGCFEVFNTPASPSEGLEFGHAVDTDSTNGHPWLKSPSKHSLRYKGFVHLHKSPSSVKIIQKKGCREEE